MKRIFLVLMAVIISAGVSAQELRLGATAGLNFASAHVDNGSSSGGYIGFQLGAKAELDLSNQIANGFYLDGKMVYTLKGGRWATYHYNFGYIEVPVSFSYRHPISDKVSLMGGLGPYVGLGILGKSVLKEVNGTKLKTDIFGSTYKRFDFGLNYHAGVELWDNWQFFLAFEHSLMNIRHKYLEGDNYKLRPMNFYIGTAYMF